MATIENTYTGDGITVLYPFTFEYITAQDVKVQLNGTDTTAYTLANATTVELTTAPLAGVAIRIYRDTSTDSMPATFFAGSTIRAQDLNDNFNVALFVSKEAQESAASAADALPVATAAQALAQTAENNAQTAIADAAAANTAALSATTDASAAQAAASNAQAVANSAEATANAAAALVASANLPQIVADVAAIPGSPALNALVEVLDSTGIESFTPLTGLPVGFTGESGISVSILWDGSTWSYLEYRAVDPDDRYLTDADLVPLQSDISSNSSVSSTALSVADGALQRTGGIMSGFITFAVGQDFGITNGDGTTAGLLKLSDDVDSSLTLGGATAATPKAVKRAYERATTAINTANNADSLSQSNLDRIVLIEGRLNALEGN